jgi:hypothetical protein
MTALWKKTNESYESSAKVVDGNLIISLPDALNPVVWRMELGSVKASALEVRQHANDGTFLLSLKTPKGDVHDIAPFDSRDRAVQALMRISNALQNASGKMNPPSLAVPGISTAQELPSRPALSGAGPASVKWLVALGGVIVVIFLFAQLSNMAQQRATETSGEQPATSITGAPSAETGVPQSADEALRGF